MIIRDLRSEPNFKHATVELDYDEIRCLTNSFCELSQFSDLKLDPEFDNVRRNLIMLFSLVKHGNIPKFELNVMHRLSNGEKPEDSLTSESKPEGWVWYEDKTPSSPEGPEEVNACGWQCSKCGVLVDEFLSEALHQSVMLDNPDEPPTLQLCPNCFTPISYFKTPHKDVVGFVSCGGAEE